MKAVKLLIIFLFASHSAHADFLEWIKCPWTWGAIALSAATVKIGHYAYLSKKKETKAKQIDRARDELRKYPEKDIQVLMQIRFCSQEKKFIAQKVQTESFYTLRKIGYPDIEHFDQSIEIFNVNPENSPKATARIEKHLNNLFGSPDKQKKDSIYIPPANKLHKRQLKTLAWGTAAVAVACAAGECWAQSCQ